MEALRADIDICEGPDRLQTEISATSTEMAGGSPPAYVDICVIPDMLRITKSVKTVMSDKSMMMDTPYDVVTRMEIASGSPPAEIRISKSPDRLQTEISVTLMEMVGGSPPADIDICEGPDRLQTEISTTSTEMAGGGPPAYIDKSGSATESVIRDGSGVRKVDGEICYKPKNYMFGWLGARR